MYNDDERTFSYPQIDDNIERVKGELYWTNTTLCGTEHVKETEYSLIDVYKSHNYSNGRNSKKRMRGRRI